MQGSIAAFEFTIPKVDTMQHAPLGGGLIWTINLKFTQNIFVMGCGWESKCEFIVFII